MRFVVRAVAILLLVAAWPTSAAPSADGPRKLIIDGDPGVDDALAIVAALQYPGFEVLGITTTFGNASIEQTTRNALRIVELSGRSIPVFRGAGTPIGIPLGEPPDFVHGKDGLGDTHQPQPKIQAEPRSAVDFLVDSVRTSPGEITILAVGRSTNLAGALARDPDFAKNVREVVVMGGTFYVPGNVSPVAEANIGGDPHAADRVVTAAWPLTMVGLDVTTKVRIDDAMLRRVQAANDRYGDFLWAITRFYAEFHRSTGVKDGFYVHDPSAVAYLVDPSLFTIKRGPVRVVTEGIAIGETILAAYPYQYEMAPWKGQPMVGVAVDVDRPRFEKTIEALLSGP